MEHSPDTGKVLGSSPSATTKYKIKKVGSNGNERKYYPDFYVNKYNYYIEFKGWITDIMKHKMSDALKRNKFNLLIIYGDDKRYKDLGLNLSMIKNNPKHILYKIGV